MIFDILDLINRYSLYLYLSIQKFINLNLFIKLKAALGPLAYEQLRNNEGNEEFEMALDIVRLSVLTFFLAPIGYFLMNYIGPIFLEKITEEQRQKERELSYLRILSLLPESSKNQE